MYKLLAYLKHLRTATNQYGVHSPFVYDYLTKCLYVKSKYKAQKSEKILLKSIPYFSMERFKISSKDSGIEHRIRKEFGADSVAGFSFDLVYLDAPSADSISDHTAEIHNESIILVDNIHSTKKNTILWEIVKQNEIVTVSIDMFYCGILFFRKEQAKEHFKIRI